MSNLDTVVDEFLTLLGYMRDHYFRPAQRITRHRLSPGHFHALSTLYHKGPLPMRELACELQVSKQQLTPLIDRLIETQMASRKADESDRRITLIEIAEKGRDTCQELGAEIRHNFREKLKDLPEPELQELEQLIPRIGEILKTIS